MNIIVGTAGHIDHGKTALVKALTGIDADRLPEEKQRGITIDLGFAEMSVGDTRFGFVDVPGHEKFVRNMLAGASGIDVVLLVVAADEGVMPQTREHFDICRLLDIKAGIIALTKSDLVDAETLELAKLDVAELVTGSFLEGAPVIAVSSKTGLGTQELKDALATQASQRQPSGDDPLIARLPIDRSFTIKGFGTVVTGTMHSGRLSAASQIELLPERRLLRIRGLQSHGISTDTALAGQRVAVNLANIGDDEIDRGTTLADTGVLEPTHAIDVRVEMLNSSSRPLRSRARVRVHIGTAEILGRVRVLNEAIEIAPGQVGFAQLRLESSAVAIIGERLILRSYSPQLTIGGGVVVDNAPQRHRRRTFEQTSAHLDGLYKAMNEPTKLLTTLITLAGAKGVDIHELQARTGFLGDYIETTLDKLAETITSTGGRWLHRSVFAGLKATALQAIENEHKRDPLSKGVSREALSGSTFKHLPPGILTGVLDSLAAEGSIAVDGELVRLASHAASLSPDEQSFSDRLLAVYCDDGLEVQKVADATSRAADGLKLSGQTIAKLIRLLVDDGRLIKVNDDFYFEAGVIDRLTRTVRQKLTADFDVAAFKDIAGVSRKYAIPLLEYFDRTHVTARVRDKRVVIR